MKIDQLLDALGDIAPHFIREAEEDAFPGRRSSFGPYQKKFVYFVSAAACIGLVFFGARLGLFEDIRGRMEYATEAPAAAEETSAEEASAADETTVEEVPAEEEAPEAPGTAESMTTQGAEDTVAEEAAPAATTAGSADGGKADGALPETGVETAEEERTTQSEALKEDTEEMKQDKAMNILIAIDQVAAIKITDGNTGRITVIEDEKRMEEILVLYAALQFREDTSLEHRLGYSRCMRLMDESGNLLQTVTPYEDAVNIDGVMYDSSDGTSGKLLEKLELF